VWLGWRERLDVYIGTGVVLVRRRDHALVSHEHPATVPLSDVLAQLDEACERSKARPWSLNVFLGAALCPAVPFTLPAGVRRWSEVMAVVQASAAAAWGLPPEQAQELVCTLDQHRTDLAAAMMAGTHQQIEQWAALGGGRLASLQPLWATVTSAPGCRPTNIRRLTLHEPGAVTELIDPLFTGAAAQGPDGIHLRFHAQALPHRKRWPQAPAAWAEHWELLP
jgi:hypothetical protein